MRSQRYRRHLIIIARTGAVTLSLLVAGWLLQTSSYTPAALRPLARQLYLWGWYLSLMAGNVWCLLTVFSPWLYEVED